MFSTFPSFPKQLLLSPSFASVAPASVEVYANFFSKLQDFLGATQKNFSIAEQWNATSGVGIPVTTYLNEVRYIPISFSIQHDRNLFILF